MKNSIKETSQELISEFSNQGSGEVEICIDDSQETKITYEQSDFSVSSSSHVATVGIRSIIDGGVGFVTSNSLERENFKSLINEARQISRLNPANTNYRVSKNFIGDFVLIDPILQRGSVKDLMKFADTFVDECQKDSRVKIERIEIGHQNITRLVSTNQRTEQTMSQSLCYWSVMGIAVDGDEVTSFDHESDISVVHKDIENLIIKTARNFSDSVTGCLGARAGGSYKGAVLLHPNAVQDILGGVIAANVNGRSQQDGMSLWKGKENSLIASKKLSVFESPLETSCPAYWKPFDREGVPTQNLAIIEQGILKLTAHNLFSSAREGKNSNGHASGGARSLPGIGVHGLNFKAGDKGLEALYKVLNKGLVVKRFSGNEDPVSGVFSGIAKNSWWVEGGERSHPVKEVMISGNLFDLLLNIQEIGSDLFRISNGIQTPYILIDGLSVTA